MKTAKMLLVLAAATLWLITCVESCSRPDLNYGYVTTSSYPYFGRYRTGAKFHFRCYEGYELEGDHMVECRYGGSWRGVVPICRKISKSCDHPRNFFGGHYYPDKSEYVPEDKIYYRCSRYNYKYTYSICGKDGRWRKADKCYDYCKKPEIEHGYFEPIKEKYYYGDKIKYYCQDGYYKHDGGEKYEMAICGEDGYWDKKKPICKKYCEAPDHKMYYHRQYKQSKYKYGEKIYFHCTDHYYKPKKYDYSESVCLYGKWNKAPYKCETYCKAPDHKMYYHRQYKQPRYKHGEKINFYCTEHYYKPYKYDYSDSVCKYGKWNNVPYKCEKYCEAPDHKMYYHGPYGQSKYKHGEKINFYCTEHYYRPKKYDYSESICKYGKWNKAPYKCEKFCKAPDHKMYYHRPYSQSKYKHGEKIHYYCVEHYYRPKKYEYSESICIHGKWNKGPYKCEKYCKAPEIIYGFYKPIKRHYDIGDRVSYGCDEGYKLFYDDVWYEFNLCKENGQWEFKEPSCKKIEPVFCKAPEITYGYYKPVKKHYNIGDPLTYGCDEGYKLFYGDVWYEFNLCKENGLWEYKKPSCKKIAEEHCMVDSIKYGHYEPMKKYYKHGEKISYRCDYGYHMEFTNGHKHDYWTCQFDGNWDNKAPVCMKYCYAPRNYKHGEYFPKKSQFDLGEKITFHCYHGYRLSSPADYSECGHNGQWKWVLPHCRY